MSAEDLPFFKFVSAVIESGLWGRMSSAARTLYPVLLRFSDRNYKEVYPGSQRLLELTGFRQKSTLRKARQELVKLGLISVTTGSGRRSTHYAFRFDFVERGKGAPPWVAESRSSGDHLGGPLGGENDERAGRHGRPPYNQIQISINNHPAGATPANEQSRLDFLNRRFGSHALELARNECALTGASPTAANLEMILYRSPGSSPTGWSTLETMLASKISAGSMALIRNAFLGEKAGLLVFSDDLPGQLKVLLERTGERVFFEPTPVSADQSRRSYWRELGEM